MLDEDISRRGFLKGMMAAAAVATAAPAALQSLVDAAETVAKTAAPALEHGELWVRALGARDWRLIGDIVMGRVNTTQEFGIKSGEVTAVVVLDFTGQMVLRDVFASPRGQQIAIGVDNQRFISEGYITEFTAAEQIYTHGKDWKTKAKIYETSLRVMLSGRPTMSVA